jgi:hypothetical protein
MEKNKEGFFMLLVSKRCPLEVDLFDYISVKDLAEMMDIYEESAKELMNGVIEFEEDEIKQVFGQLGIGLALPN